MNAIFGKTKGNSPSEGIPSQPFLLTPVALVLRSKETHRKAQKHKGDKYETDREESDGCYVCFGLIVGDVP
jgi:hypothetical protein